MMEPATPLSLVLVCGTANRVHRVVRNPGELPIAPEEPFAGLFEVGSREKALRLLQSIRDRRTAFGWELHVRTGRGPLLLQFCGAGVQNGILIVGAESRSYASALFARLMQDAEFGPSPSEPGPSTGDLYEQLAALNNQLLAMQRELEKRNAELTRLLEDRARLAAMAAHDLRTPLQVIATGTEALEQVLAGQTAPVRRILDMITRNTAVMRALTKDLLASYQPDIGRLDLSMEPLDLVALARTNVQNNRAMAEQKNLSLTFRSSGEVPRVLADPLRLDQVLNNLVHNAIKFSPPGSAIDVAVSGTEAEASLHVEDRGVGLTRDQLEALLGGASVSRPGTQTEPGFGLGFAIVRSIVERHQGRIDARSEPGDGATFTVRLPAYRPDATGVSPTGSGPPS